MSHDVFLIAVSTPVLHAVVLVGDVDVVMGSTPLTRPVSYVLCCVSCHVIGIACYVCHVVVVVSHAVVVACGVYSLTPHEYKREGWRDKDKY